MEQIKVSLLVPIYGVEKYIERCAVSLFEQTYANLEYIFVNDCTRDNSIKVLNNVIERYPQRREQIRLIQHDCNRGLAAARNTAVDAASGDFIMHVDSDDWLETQAVKKCVEKQSENDADIVTMDAKVWWPKKKEYYRTPHTTNPIELMTAILSKKAVCNIWGRLIRKSLYTDNKIRVIEGINFSEDLQIIPQLLYFSRNINYCSDNLYNYESRNICSYTSNFSEKKDSQNQKTAEILRDFYKKNAPEYLTYINLLEATNLIQSIKGCMKTVGHENYYKSVKLRITKINKSLYKQIPIYDRLVLIIKNKFVLRIYIRLASLIKQIF